ncbi:MAG: sporulation protein YunB [Oscillospiraceae bacterium]|nr:sporulation protein YunB [Oscillospiraceae bacterium]
MNRKKRNRRRLLIAAAAGLLIALALLIRYRINPVLQELACASVTNEAAGVINAAVERAIAERQIDYDKIVHVDKDEKGNVSAIKTNIAEINSLKNEVLREIDSEIMQISVSEISIPLGSVVLPSLFAGKGPDLPVRIVSIASSSANFSSVFTSAGINQTLHQILLNSSVTMTVLTPLGTQNVTASSELIAAETVIVGVVPNTYLNREF